MKRLAIRFALSALLLSCAAFADDLNDVTAEFLALDAGYASVDTMALEAAIEAQLPDTGSVFLASSQLSPLAKALLAAEVHDGPLWLYRYQLQLTLEHVSAPPAADPVPVLLVDLKRFNLGPAQHAGLVEELGEDVVAPVEEFGSGPHTAWRLVLSPVMGQPAAILDASRRELDDAEAALATCLGAPCLELYPLIEEAAVWQDHEAVSAEAVDSLLTVPHPGAMLDMLASHWGFDPYQSETTGQVLAELLIETAGAQDDFIDVALRQGPLADDSLLAVWQRVYAFPGAGDGPQLYTTEAYECRRGPDTFAGPGEFCL